MFSHTFRPDFICTYPEGSLCMTPTKKTRSLLLILLGVCCCIIPFLVLQTSGPAPGQEKTEIQNGTISVDTSAEAVTLRRKTLQLARENNDTPGEVLALNALGEYHFLSRHSDSALYYHNASLSLARKNQMLHQQVVSLEKMATCYVELSEYEKAFPFLTEALSVSRKLKDPNDLALALQELGIYYLGEGHWEIMTKRWFVLKRN
jgi:tetratricopeptide (TPR) repeat protein